ncbi:hypothetical protein [Gulosibacter sp. 10]|uniref:hypothetical protein n=1 Tax=Gulosibacter sp. 10 TaxID=1255570 RepID=UPI00097F6245|nr:hypothetical protein [Gulosibacter sp. 10]SJM61634.1 hypothetical protein FM112_07965 [Gulosibacter sp. 10]
MVSTNPDAGTNAEEPILGAPPALSDAQWDGMLTTAFEAPPGFADGIVDLFEGTESAGTENSDAEAIDAESIAPDFTELGGGVGQESTADAGIDVSGTDGAEDEQLIDLNEEDGGAAPAEEAGDDADAISPVGLDEVNEGMASEEASDEEIDHSALEDDAPEESGDEGAFGFEDAAFDDSVMTDDADALADDAGIDGEELDGSGFDDAVVEDGADGGFDAGGAEGIEL